MSLHLSQSLVLSQSLSLRMLQTQKLTARVLGMPRKSLDMTLDAIASDPRKADEILPTLEPGADGIRSLYSGFFESKGLQNKGLVADLSVENLGDLCTPPVGSEPDVIYIGQKNEKPRIVLSEHLKPRPSLRQVEIPKQFKKAQRLYSQLVSTRDFITKTLGELYFRIGEAQREFLFSGLFADLHKYDQSQLAGDMGYSASTISRLTNRALVQVGDPGYIIPANFLIPNEAQWKRHLVLPRLQTLLDRETSTSAMSDADMEESLSSEFGPPHIVRRTIAKYRKELGIPPAPERKLAYGRGETYSLPLGMWDVGIESLWTPQAQRKD